MVVGAHPDDCESAGGIALKLKDRGWRVRFLSATNGAAGHQTMQGAALALRRQEEARRVSVLTGIEYEILDVEDGSLTTNLPDRTVMMRAIRLFSPDVIITHRPWDYHPDHRNTSTLVQDCSYLLQVPNVCPLTPPMRFPPAIFYIQDRFQKPYPFRPDLVFDVSDKAKDKLLMYHQYTSQMYEWLPWVDHVDPADIPSGDAERLLWLSSTRFGTNDMFYADRFRAELVQKYGDAGERATHAEALEICEYGAQLADKELSELFPF